MTPEKSAPFSIVCCECDDGMNTDSRERAEMEGWTEITYTPDLPMANYLGVCPACKEFQ